MSKLDLFETFEEAVKRYPEDEETKRKKQKTCEHEFKWLQFNHDGLRLYSIYQCPKCLLTKADL